MPIRLDGTSADYTTLSTSGVPSTTAFTITWWMQVVNANAGTDRYILDMFDSGVVNRYSVWRPGSNNDGMVSNSSFPSMSGNEDQTSWYMWAVTCSGTGATDLKCYNWKLGDPDGTYNSLTTTGRSFVISEWHLGGTYYSTGRDARLCFVKIWDAALSLSELQAERAIGKPVRTTSINRYHRLETSADTSDGSGNGRTITLTGAATEGTEPVPWENTGVSFWLLKGV